MKRPADVLFAVLGPLVPGQVLADPDQPEDLPAGGLEVQVRIRHVQHFDPEGDDSLPQFVDVAGFQLQVDRLQKAALRQRDALVLVEKREIEAVAQPEVILPVTLPGDLAPQDVTVESTDCVPFRPGTRTAE